jgi:hypothetical protein
MRVASKSQAKRTMALIEKIILKFERLGKTPPDHMAVVGILVGLGYTPHMILSAVDVGLGTKELRFTSMNWVNTYLALQREKHSPKQEVKEPEEPKPNKLGSEAHVRILLKLYKEKGYWESGWYCGDKPGNPYCLIDPKLLEEFGLPPTPPRPPEIKRKING